VHRQYSWTPERADLTDGKHGDFNKPQDGGKAWDQPEPTNIPSGENNSTLRRLPDGRLAIFGTFADRFQGERRPLCIAISDDGKTFSRVYRLGTGVSKFSMVSVFSDLNNLTDLTMAPQAATLLGYTQEEVEANFPDYIERLARALGTSVPETLDELGVWYNGYKYGIRGVKRVVTVTIGGIVEEAWLWIDQGLTNQHTGHLTPLRLRYRKLASEEKPDFDLDPNGLL
jgi:hypothetical protein